jgi:hypothetical protein
VQLPGPLRQFQEQNSVVAGQFKTKRVQCWQAESVTHLFDEDLGKSSERTFANYFIELVANS